MMTGTDTQRIQRIVRSAKTVLTGADFPVRMVVERYRYSYLFDFETVFSENYFAALKSLIDRKHTCFTLVVLDPDPFEYFLRNFDLLPAINIASDMSFEDYIRELNSAPADWPADAIIFNSYNIIIVDDAFESVFVFLRSHEIGVGYFSSREMMLAARQVHTDGIIEPADELTMQPHMRERVKEYARRHASL